MDKPKLIRITTVASSLKILLKGQHAFMSDHYEVVGISGGDPDLDAVSKEEGIRTIPVKMTRTIAPFKDLRSVWRLYRIFRSEKPLIVHTHTPKAGFVGMFASRLAGVKIRMHTVAGLPLMEAKGWKRWLLNRVEKLTYAYAHGVYPNSRGLYDFILEHKFTSEKKLKVIAEGSSNGIDVSYFDPERISKNEKNELKGSLGIESDDFVFIFVGRLVGDKGLNELIAAFKQLSPHYNNCKLLLVGGAEAHLDPLLPETLVEMDANDRILRVGFQNDVRPYFAISDALVFPTYREGFPNVVMQAGAMGLPAIVSNINGCNEIIVEGENGTIIPPKDAGQLRNAMERFANDKGLANKGTLCRSMIVDRYQQTAVWQALLEEYKKQEDRVS